MKVKKKLNVSAKSSLQEAVKNVKEILKVKNVKKESNEEVDKKPEVKKNLTKVKREKPKRGLAIVTHLPHGFYEDQLKGYFAQFGKVTRVRLKRSQRTGRSCGYGYVEFAMPEVAKIASETMNNYLMNGRLVKAKYVSPEENHGRYFRGKQITRFSYPTLTRRKKFKAVLKRKESEEKQQSKENKCLAKLLSLEETLKENGVGLKFNIPSEKKSALLGIKKGENSEVESEVEEVVEVIPQKKVKLQHKSKKQVQPPKEECTVPTKSVLTRALKKKRGVEAQPQKNEEEVIIPPQKKAKPSKSQKEEKIEVKTDEVSIPKGKKVETKLPKKAQAAVLTARKQENRASKMIVQKIKPQKIEKELLKKAEKVTIPKTRSAEKNAWKMEEVVIPKVQKVEKKAKAEQSKVSKQAKIISPKQKPLVKLPSKGKKVAPASAKKAIRKK